MRDFGGAYSFSMPNVEELPDMPEVMDPRTPVLGINAEDLTSQLGSYFGAPNNAGVLVREVRPGTPADKAGLKAGDVITKVEGKEVRTLADLRAQLREKSNQAFGQACLSCAKDRKSRSQSQSKSRARWSKCIPSIAPNSKPNPFC